MKHIVVSIKPQYVAKILNGEKTLEVRKSAPKEVLKGEECLVEIYCTKGKTLYKTAESNEYLEYASFEHWSNDDIKINGTVVANFTLNRVNQYGYVYSPAMFVSEYRKIENDNFTSEKFDYKSSCLSSEELLNYTNDEKLLPRPFFGWHIDDLEIYDKPKQLEEFRLKRAPQSWCYIN